ncbi:Uncharacterized protein FWK35_00014009 [Aphis craccivora]|uniref:Uncharacterized protein n=1 Tax=Aphis craccivora TaxID=307492 RepID=A0A6G0YSH7_APHCR|nr:Uncharacterized protein FWK35_00014009 [Aphis craccivora]
MQVVNLNLRESARLIVREVLVFWEKARIPVRLEKHCISKVESSYDEWRILQKHAARNTASHIEQEDLFISKFNNLFKQSAQTEENLMEIDKTLSDLETDDCHIHTYIGL